MISHHGGDTITNNTSDTFFLENIKSATKLFFVTQSVCEFYNLQILIESFKILNRKRTHFIQKLNKLISLFNFSRKLSVNNVKLSGCGIFYVLTAIFSFHNNVGGGVKTKLKQTVHIQMLMQSKFVVLASLFFPSLTSLA